MPGRVRWLRASSAPSAFSAGAAAISGVGRRGRRLGPWVVVGLLGCSSNGASGTDLGIADLASAGPKDLTAPNPDALTTAYDNQFIGFWGIKAKVASIQTLPVFGDKGSTNTVLSVGQFRRDAMNKLVVDQQECRITVQSEVSFIKTDVPDKIAETTPLLTGAVQVYGQAGLLGFNRAEVATGIGCKLTDPFKDPLPTDKTDPKIFDQDADTKLGVTVMPQAPIQGEVYVAQRRKYSYLNGLQQSATRLTGSIVDRSEQYILDASDPQLKSQVVTRPVDAMSVFEMVKLPSQYPCTQLRAEADTLFTLK